ncbi:MAG: hypothetical protein V5A68_05635 [Candidatus Thermoplasmatota archaeon]
MRKVRTVCPECDKNFVAEIEKDVEKQDVECPQCNHSFSIQPKKEEKEISWEEHGEPRKTVLSSIRPKTNKPMIASLLLIIVFFMAIISASFPEIFVESTLDVFSAAGLEGEVEVDLLLEGNSSVINNVSVTLDGKEKTGFSNDEGKIVFGSVDLGLKKVLVNSRYYQNVSHEILVVPFFKTSHNVELNLAGNNGGVDRESFNSVVCSLVFIILSVFPLLAAFGAFKRFHLDLAMVGSLVGIFTFGFLLIGSILSIVSFIILYYSRDEFENGKKGKTF